MTLWKWWLAILALVVLAGLAFGSDGAGSVGGPVITIMVLLTLYCWARRGLRRI